MNLQRQEQSADLNDLVAIIRRLAGNPEGDFEINPEMSLIDDLNLDSLRMVDLLLDVEDRFQIAIQDSDVKSLFTVGDLTELVMRQGKR